MYLQPGASDFKQNAPSEYGRKTKEKQEREGTLTKLMELPRPIPA